MTTGGHHLVALVNPAAGSGRGGLALTPIRRSLEERYARFQVIEIPAAGETAATARRVMRECPDRILIVGGDGTVSEAVHGFMDSEGPVPPFAVLPAGRGCDFARGLGLPANPDRILDCMEELPQPIDAGSQSKDGNVRYFVNIADAGLAGLVAHHSKRLAPMNLGGLLTYFLATSRAIFTRRSWPMTLKWDGGEDSGRFINVSVANGSHFGGGMHIAPAADAGDGMFDVVAIRSLGLIRIWSLIPYLYGGTLTSHPQVLHFRCRNLTIESPESTPTELDGEIGPVTPVTFTIHPSALRIYGVGKA